MACGAVTCFHFYELYLKAQSEAITLFVFDLFLRQIMTCICKCDLCKVLFHKSSKLTSAGRCEVLNPPGREKLMPLAEYLICTVVRPLQIRQLQ